MLRLMAAARRPFRIDATPSKPGTADGESPAVPRGKNTTLVPNQPLQTPSQVTDEAKHGHSPQIAWPKAGGADDARKPMKFRN